MRIAITGGRGVIGSAVTELALAQGHSVVCIDRALAKPRTVPPNVTYIQADITRYADIERVLRGDDALSGCDALLHLAAIPSPHQLPAHEVHNNNVVGSYNALMAAADAGITRVCQASSVNAIGAAFSRWPRYDYFPLDERHPTYNEDPYSLSKWICEQQADSIARRYQDMRIASLRMHWVVPDRATVVQRSKGLGGINAKQLWGYTCLEAAARACMLALTADFVGHEVFHIIAPRTSVDTPSLDLKQRFFPDVPVRGDLSGHGGFFDCAKARRLLGWLHDEPAP